MKLASSAGRAPPGSGVCRTIPCTVGSPLSVVKAARMPAAVACWDSGRSGSLGTKSVTSQAMPALTAVLASDRTYQALASSAVAVTTASRGVRPAAVSSAARAAVAARISAASSRPDSSRAASSRPYKELTG
jgi:hypothetical protein